MAVEPANRLHGSIVAKKRKLEGYAVKKVLMVYPEKCTGCGSCELACSFMHENEFKPSASRIGVFRSEEDGANMPMTCFQCEEAACQKACKPGALWRDENGVVRFEESKCIGCKMCVMACPFGNIAYDREEKKIRKCDLCGGTPQCAAFCPVKAIEYLPADAENMNKRRAFSEKMVQALKEVK